MEEVKNLTTRTGEWLSGKGPQSDVVLSSRVRLARNLAGFPFLSKASDTQKEDIAQLVREGIDKAGLDTPLQYYDLKDAPSLDRLLLVERHLISKELAGESGPRGVAFSEEENVAVMVNEEDHLRIQVVKSGLQLTEAWEEINSIDDKLAGVLDYAYSTQYGYLTVCPTNVGTGIRVSVMLHLPALVMTRQIDKVFQAMAKINLAVRGYYGERTEALGDYYQVSNQVTLGKDEPAIVDSLLSVVPQVINYEQKVRETLLVENRRNLEDRIWRAFGILSYARSISSEETMELLSALRLGINLNLLGDIDQALINPLFLQTQPAHLQMREHSNLTPAERDFVRAELLREVLADATPKKDAAKKPRAAKKKNTTNKPKTKPKNKDKN